MDTVLDILMAAALFVGLAFNTLGVFGILRFPDVYTRLHAFQRVLNSMGAEMSASGSALMNLGSTIGWVVLAIVAVVVLAVTNATGGHAIARAVWHLGIRPARAVCDALAADKAKADPEEGKKEGEA